MPRTPPEIRKMLIAAETALRSFKTALAIGAPILDIAARLRGETDPEYHRGRADALNDVRDLLDASLRGLGKADE